jgi:hypothetical protein
VDSVANRRLIAGELHNDDKAVKKLFAVLGPRYKERAGGYTRVLHAGMRYGDAAEMAVIELVGRDAGAKKSAVKPAVEKTEAKKEKQEKRAPAKIAKEADTHVRAAKGVKEVSVKRRATGK